MVFRRFDAVHREPKKKTNENDNNKTHTNTTGDVYRSTKLLRLFTTGRWVSEDRIPARREYKRDARV